MNKLLSIIFLLATSVLSFSCMKKTCPAYVSSFVTDKIALNEYFSTFLKDSVPLETPKFVVQINKKTGRIERKLASSKSLYVVNKKVIDYAIDSTSFDSTLVYIPLGNEEQNYYDHLFGEMFLENKQDTTAVNDSTNQNLSKKELRKQKKALKKQSKKEKQPKKKELPSDIFKKEDDEQEMIGTKTSETDGF